jgi:SpoVK/Ycf46/Vps4 family AAA+-type ATPase
VLYILKWGRKVEEIMSDISLIVNQYKNEDNKRHVIERHIGSLGKKTISSDGKKDKGEKCSYEDQRFHEWNNAITPISHLLPSVNKKFNSKSGVDNSHTLETLELTPNVILAIEDIRRWSKNYDWYISRGIPYKKGILLYSKPGCGKSSLLLALAKDLDFPLHIFDLSSMNNEDFVQKWNDISSTCPAMVVFEDFDAVFNGRKNLAHSEGGLSFDCLLNTMDGVKTSDGILTIITTNDLSSIDEAIGSKNGDNISTRPGRIDWVVEMLPPTENGRRRMAKRILGLDSPEIESLVAKGEHDTGAQFQERCIRTALLSIDYNKK